MSTAALKPSRYSSSCWNGPSLTIIGPVVAALFTSVWFIFRETYSGLLEAEGDPPGKDAGNQE